MFSDGEQAAPAVKPAEHTPAVGSYLRKLRQALERRLATQAVEIEAHQPLVIAEPKVAVLPSHRIAESEYIAWQAVRQTEVAERFLAVELHQPHLRTDPKHPVGIFADKSGSAVGGRGNPLQGREIRKLKIAAAYVAAVGKEIEIMIAILENITYFLLVDESLRKTVGSDHGSVPDGETCFGTDPAPTGRIEEYFVNIALRQMGIPLGKAFGSSQIARSVESVESARCADP